MHSPTHHCTQAICLLSLLITWPSAHADLPQEADHQPVTGSRLLTADPHSAAPLTVYTRDDILHSGENNLADFIRSLSVNTFGSFRPQSGTTSQNISTVSLKGLGSGRNLVLIDGRRLPKSPTNASAQDLNLIPLVAVDRIEVLAEGAGAIYGSHAMSGVINVITRDEFVGTELMLGGAEVSIPRNGGQRESGSVVFGTRHERGGLTAAVGWNDREIVLQRDLPWNQSIFSVFGNSFTTLTDEVDDFNWTSLPGACLYPGSAFTEVPNPLAINSYRCAFDVSQASADEASIENKSMFINAHHRINDQWTLESATRFWQTTSFGQSAPSPDSSYFSTPLSPYSPNNPTNPNSSLFNPELNLSPQPINWWHRFDALGNTTTTIQTQLQDLQLELNGELPGGELNLGLRFTDNRATDVTRNLLLRSAASTFIESGEYSLLNPYATPTAVLDGMRVTAYREARYDQGEAYLQWTFNDVELAGINTQLVVGAEFLKEQLADLYDPQTLSQTIPRTADTQAHAQRHTHSLYSESVFSFSDQLQSRLALRFDDYSDLASDVSTHWSVHYQPLPQLGVYASHAVSHQAADLLVMNTIKPATTSAVRDLSACLYVPEFCEVRTTVTQQVNDKLKSEQMTAWNIGLVFTSGEWLKAQINHWDNTIDDLIRYLPVQEILTREFIDGTQPPAGFGCSRSLTGRIRNCRTGYINEGVYQASGIDFKANFHYPLAGLSAQTELTISHILEQRLNRSTRGRNQVGEAGKPKNRATLIHRFNWQDWQLVLQTHFIDSQQPYGGQLSRVPSWVTHDVQLNYATSWQGLITLGAQNMAEKHPPVGLGAIGNRSYDFELYDGFGRIVYARYTQSF